MSTQSSKGRIRRILHLDTPFDPDHAFVTSPFLSPLTLAVIRLTLALYTLVDVIVNISITAVRFSSSTDPSDKVSGFFSYFTHLTYIGLIAYLWASGVQTLAYVRNKQKGYPLQRWPRTLQYLHTLLYSSITTYPILVTIVYWALLASPATFNTTFHSWASISEHIFNTVFALFEIFLTHGSPLPWIQVLFLDIMLAGYLGVAYVTHVTQGFYPYSFLDVGLHGKVVAAYIVGIAVAEVVIFIIVRYLMVLREKIARRRKAAHEPPATEQQKEALDEWEEVTPEHIA
ncbi:hypothetical protein BXZ70DRAFT_1063203 [Cristinia sonorae]|uniref:FAR-17a/AIG1-like protein n=1 Tax=Cristinia sonorae TaxID=1940300 RepID=A0A8K0UQX8_9AGAR|nr:hypothetical protein BXZ70DRAFT_1063203 [Cristinia sonorae]